MKKARRKTEASFRSLLDVLRSLEGAGELEPGQVQEAIKAVKEMRHAYRVEDKLGFNKGVEKLCRTFLRQ